MSTPTEIFFPETLPFPFKIVSLEVRPTQTVRAGSRLLKYSFVYHPTDGTDQGETRYGSWESTFDGELKSWDVRVGDVISRQWSRDRPALHVVEPCKHGIQVNGLCALCGMDMENFDYTGRAESSRATIQMTHSASGPTVSLEEAQRIERETAEHLLKSRKLSLIVDLDQTIVHATVDPTVGEWIREGESWEARRAERENRNNRAGDERNEEDEDSSSESSDDEDEEVNPNWDALKDVKKFHLAPETFGAVKPPWNQRDSGRERSIQSEGCLYYVKPRPGWKEFLSEVAKKYEMHVYTMGTRAYAEEVCAAIDPDGRLFGGRILSRDESGSLTQKSLRRLFPVDTSMVVIIDDRADVWEWSPNLIKVIPYDFFVGIGDINSAFLPKLPADPLNPNPASEETINVPPPPVPAPPSASSSPEVKEPAADPESEEAAVPDESEKEMLTQNTLALEAQVEERPLAKQQELLEKEEDEEEQAPESPVKDPATNGDSDRNKHHHKKALLKNDDNELERVGKLLEEVHRRFYEAYDNRLPVNTAQRRRKSLSSGSEVKAYDVKFIIPNLRSATLAGVHIVFSGVIPTNMKIDYETTEIWRMARAFGATCSKDLTKEVTHVVTSKMGTQKVEKARSMGNIFVVWLQWFTDSIARWKRQDEMEYLVDEVRAASPSAPTASSPPSDPNAVSTDTEAEELVGDGDGDGDDGFLTDGENAENGETDNEVQPPEAELPTPGGSTVPDEPLNLGDIDWQDVNDEVELAMMESDSEDEGRGSDIASAAASEDEEAGGQKGLSAPRMRKRLRSLTPSEIHNVPDGLNSPLAKRKKMAADRSGLSRLKETISAEELESKDTEMQSPAVDMDEDDESSESEGEEFEDDFLARELEDELG